MKILEEILNTLVKHLKCSTPKVETKPKVELKTKRKPKASK